MIGALIGRDVRRSIGGAAWLPVAFFLLVSTLVPFAVGPDAQLLERIGGGALWIAALTAALLPIERLVDTTGAGDLFAAGFLAGEARGLGLERSLKLGAIAAAEVIQHYGARPEADLKALAGPLLA